MTTGIYSFNNSDCQEIREKFSSIFGMDETDIEETIRYIPGRIWIYTRYENFFYGGGSEIVEDIRALTELSGSRNMGSIVEYTAPPLYIGVVPLDITITNTDGTIDYLTYDLYTESTVYEIEFYICGCNELEIMCGNCCVNCCDLARTVKENYENILL